MTVLGDRPIILRNRGNGNHWLAISPIGSRSNRDGFGARINVNGQWSYSSSAGSYLSAGDKRLHFGLGAVREAPVEVLWPSGARQVLNHVSADQFITVRESR